jgi:CrcB protein
MPPLKEVIFVALGGATGSVLRHWLSSRIAHHTGDGFPYGTLVVNVLGSLVIGILFGLALHSPEDWPGRHMEALLIAGLCGGFTTFSTFSLQTFHLVERGNLTGAALNIFGSVFLCVLSVWTGVTMVRKFFG